jgi:hypothetical protein
MLEIVVLLKALTEIAGLALLGQGVLYVFAGANREQNLFYRVLKTITTPIIRVVRFITPRSVADRHIGMAAFFLLAGIWLALIIEYRGLCVEEPRHSACERLVRTIPAGEPGTLGERAR